MSQRWLPGELRQVSCFGKVRYDSGPQAAKAMQRMKKKRVVCGAKRGDVSIYRCDYCHGFHLGRGSQNPKFRE